MTTVYGLRQIGYDVKIRHVREFIGVERKGDDEFMTRGEYEQARLNGELEYQGGLTELFYQDQGVALGKMPSYGKAVSPINGWTEVTITTLSGRTAKAKCSFADKPFCRKLGVSVALSKALFQLSDEYEVREAKKNAPRTLQMV